MEEPARNEVAGNKGEGTMTRLAVTGLAAGVLGVGLAAGMQWRDLRSELAQGAQLRERVGALEEAQLAAAAASPPSTPSILPVVAAPQPAGTAAAAPAAPATSPPAASAAPAAAKPLTTAEAVLANPQVMEMTRSMLRQLLPQQYPDIATEMNMSAAEVEKLFDTLARQQMDFDMSGSMAMFMGGQLDPAAVQDMERKMQQQQKAHEAELAAQLGSKYAQWQDYQGTAAARQQVDRLQAVLDAENRLSEAGRKSVIAALAVEEARFTRQQREEPMAGGRNMQEMLQKELERTTEYNQRRIQAASPHLTVAQRDAYKRLLDQQTSMANMMMRSMAAPAGAQP